MRAMDPIYGTYHLKILNMNIYTEVRANVKKNLRNVGRAPEDDKLNVVQSALILYWRIACPRAHGTEINACSGRTGNVTQVPPLFLSLQPTIAVLY